MAKERAPRDEHTGVPLLLAPHLPVKELMRRAPSPGRVFCDDHHSYFNRRNKLLRGKGGLAVRHARIQRVARIEQHDRLHNECYDEPLLPETADEQFTQVVLCTAHYIPPFAVDVVSPIPRIFRLDFRQIRRFLESGEVSVESPVKTCSFMESFVLARNVDGIDKRLVKEFLFCPNDSAYDRKRQADMARTLLTLTVREPVADLEQEYAFGYQNGLLSPEAPPDPVEYVVGQLAAGTVYEMQPLITRLQDKFARFYLGMPQTAPT